MFDFTDMGEANTLVECLLSWGVQRKQTEGCSMLLELEIEGDYRNSTGSVIFPLDRHSTTRSLMSGLRVAPLYHTNISFVFSLVVWQSLTEHSDCNGAGLKS